MPVTVYKLGTLLAGSASGDVDVFTYGAEVASGFAAASSGDVDVFTYGVSMMYSPEASVVNMPTYGVLVCFRADEHPDGGYANAATINDIEEDDVVYTDVIFPECISYGSTGVPRYLTDKAEVLSGDEQRNTRYRYPRHEYSINMENLPADEIATVMNIWHIVSGDYAAFLFLDPLDHTSGNTATNFSPTEITMLDQEVATANAALTDYVLYKYYTHGDRMKQRRIRYPKTDTLIVAVAGHSILSWEYDNTLAVLRFVKPIETPLADITVTKSGNTLTTSGALFADLAVGDLIFIEGFTDDAADQAIGNPLRVASVTSDNEITLKTFADGDWASGVDETDATVTVSSALPPTGALITAGFYFYVPVRFDDGDNAMSEIMAGLRETSIATFGDIKLREVFE